VRYGQVLALCLLEVALEGIALVLVLTGGQFIKGRAAAARDDVGADPRKSPVRLEKVGAPTMPSDVILESVLS
jgi:hypothetical protein